MRSLPLASLVLAALALCPLACRSSKKAPDATASASASAAAASASAATGTSRAAPAPHVTGERLDVTAPGVVLRAEVFPAREAGAPVLLLAHRAYGTRAEWATLVDTLVRGTPRWNVVTWDHRGHGDSTSAGGDAGATVAWNKLKPAEWARLVPDAKLVADAALKKLDAEAAPVVVVGSDVGAAVAASLAAQLAHATAVGAISPGAAIAGIDVYKPFAAVRAKAAFLAAAQDDNVSREPLAALATMATDKTLARYPGVDHSAERLGGATPQLWENLVAWLNGRARAAPPKP